ncbi:hypothetical protein [Streptomyces sp. NPDC101249]|uniref:hypothetical protein n=1 Tax=Streptomyces sp. NPDC101249 TaxID=3366140 RepID=UPI00381B079B
MQTTDDTVTASPRRRRRRGRRVLFGAVASAVVVGGVVAVTWRTGDKNDAGSGGSPVRVATAVVTRGDLSNTQTLDGNLGFGRASTVRGGKAGLVTWLPKAGATVRRGEPLYRVDNVPVPVFYGTTPLYRTLAAVGTTGPDVRTVADNLRALGYDTGLQPPVGTWVTPGPAAPDSPPAPSADAGAAGAEDPQSPSRPPGEASPAPAAPVRVGRGDGVLTAGLVSAVKRWQSAAGTTPTGVLGVGDLSVQAGAVRVDGVQAQLADAADGALMTVTDTAKSVTVSVHPSEAGSIHRGDTVSVSLPDDSTVRGRVRSIGGTVRVGDASDGGAEPGLTVGVALDDTAAVRGLDSAPVRVRFTSKTRRGVLTVPVGALMALREGGYAVQLPGGRLTAVRTGMFSQGAVEISGAGIHAGTKVVTVS